MQSAFEAMVAPKRREILRLLHGTELTAGAIAANFGDVSRPAISQHLRVLREAGLIRERRDGTRRLYTADTGGLEALRTYLERFWDERLETLKAEAEREERSRTNARDIDPGASTVEVTLGARARPASPLRPEHTTRGTLGRA